MINLQTIRETIMDHQFSSAIASFCGKTDIYTAMTLVRDAGYQGLDFPFSVYSVGYCPPLLQEDWKNWIKGVKRFGEKLGLSFVQGHAAWLHGCRQAVRPRTAPRWLLRAVRRSECVRLDLLRSWQNELHDV